MVFLTHTRKTCQAVLGRSRKTCQAIQGQERSAQATGYTIWGSYLVGYKTFLSSTKRPDRVRGPPSLVFDGKWRSFPVIKRSPHDVDHSTTSRAEVKEKAKLKFSPPVRLHRKHRYRFTLTFHGTYSGFPNYRKFHLEISASFEIRYHIFASSDTRMQSAQAEHNSTHSVWGP